MRRYQILLPDKRIEQLDVLAAVRSIHPSVVLRLLVMDGIDKAVKEVRSERVEWRDTLLEIDQRYSAR